MSASSDALAAGFDTLLDGSGENVSFRGIDVTVLIDRQPYERVVRSPNFNPRGQTRIEVRVDDLDGVPQVGEEFIDENAEVHRILDVPGRRGDWYVCECKVSAGAPVVAVPQFRVAAEALGLDDLVDLICATSGAAIRYTTNGTTPTAASTLYTVPFTVVLGTTYKVKAFKSGYTASPTVTGVTS